MARPLRRVGGSPTVVGVAARPPRRRASSAAPGSMLARAPHAARGARRGEPPRARRAASAARRRSPVAALRTAVAGSCSMLVLVLDEFCPHTVHFSSSTSSARGAARRRAPRESRAAERRDAPGAFRRESLPGDGGERAGLRRARRPPSSTLARGRPPTHRSAAHLASLDANRRAAPRDATRTPTDGAGRPTAIETASPRERAAARAPHGMASPRERAVPRGLAAAWHPRRLAPRVTP
jgi:hypothetical protein